MVIPTSFWRGEVFEVTLLDLTTQLEPDLSESMEDIPARELADELNEFFQELEALMG